MDWVSLRQAADATGVTVSALRKAYQQGRIPHRKVPGKYGDQVEVPLAVVRERVGPRPASRGTGELASGAVGPMLTEAMAAMAGLAAQLAEASERAGKYEAEARLLREQLEKVTAERNALERKTRGKEYRTV